MFSTMIILLTLRRASVLSLSLLMINAWICLLVARKLRFGDYAGGQVAVPCLLDSVSSRLKPPTPDRLVLLLSGRSSDTIKSGMFSVSSKAAAHLGNFPFC